MNQPKYTKFKKVRKGKLKNLKHKSNKLKFGTIGLKALEAGMLTSKQIEATRKAIIKRIKLKGKVWIKIFPNIPITSKSTGVRMGKGKGPVSHWVARVRGGSILFEICSGLGIETDIKALKAGSNKLPIKTVIFK